VSAYDNDPRVVDRTGGGTVFTILPGSTTRPIGNVAPAEHGGFVGWTDGRKPEGPGFATADEAIRSLIGDPQ
jgi:hypothetical protein